MFEENCLGDADALGLGQPNLVAAVVLPRSANVETGLCVFAPARAQCWHDVHFHGGAEGCKRVGFIIVLSMEVCK